MDGWAKQKQSKANQRRREREARSKKLMVQGQHPEFEYIHLMIKRMEVECGQGFAWRRSGRHREMEGTRKDQKYR